MLKHLGAVIRKQSCDLDRKCLSQTGGTACIEKLAKELISKAFFFFLWIPKLPFNSYRSSCQLCDDEIECAVAQKKKNCSSLQPDSACLSRQPTILPTAAFKNCSQNPSVKITMTVLIF